MVAMQSAEVRNRAPATRRRRPFVVPPACLRPARTPFDPSVLMPSPSDRFGRAPPPGRRSRVEGILGLLAVAHGCVHVGGLALAEDPVVGLPHRLEVLGADPI